MRPTLSAHGPPQPTKDTGNGVPLMHANLLAELEIAAELENQAIRLCEDRIRNQREELIEDHGDVAMIQMPEDNRGPDEALDQAMELGELEEDLFDRQQQGELLPRLALEEELGIIHNILFDSKTKGQELKNIISEHIQDI